MRFSLYLFAVFLLNGAFAIPSILLFKSNIENVNVVRKIDLSNHFEQSVYTIKFKNVGNEPVESYFVALESRKASHLSYIVGIANDKKLKTTKVGLSGIEAPEGTVFYEIKLEESLKPEENEVIDVQLFFTKVLHPLPVEITQNEDQLVEFFDNVFFFSPYQTKKEKTKVNVLDNNIISYTKKKPVSAVGSEVEYGPYTDSAPFSNSLLHIHHRHNEPFITFKEVEKDIMVSHWGHASVEERYVVENTGAKLKGSFSRKDYDYLRSGQSTSFRMISGNLPGDAFDIYYRDSIGNVSSSHVRTVRKSKGKKNKHTELEMRFPLFGGWKTDFNIGYIIPASSILKRSESDGDRFIIKTRFSTPFRQADVDQLTFRVILPEGAVDIKYYAPFDIEHAGEELSFNYLDTEGRPVLVLKKSNLVKVHNQNIWISYRFASTSIFREPIFLSTLFLAFFIFSMLFSRINFSFPNEKGRQFLIKNILKDIDEKNKDALFIETMKDNLQSLLAYGEAYYGFSEKEKLEANKVTFEKLNDALNQFKNDENVEKLREIFVNELK